MKAHRLPRRAVRRLSDAQHRALDELRFSDANAARRGELKTVLGWKRTRDETRAYADVLLLGGMVLSTIACLFGESIQLSFASTNAPFPSRNSRVGFSSLPGIGNDGPIALTMTFWDCEPTTIVPAMRTLSPVWTRPRVEMLANFEFAALPRSYASTTPMPVPLFAPRTIAV